MIMPKKHITLSESLVGFGAFILEVLITPMTVEMCWNTIYNDFISKGKISKKQSFDNFILSLDFLYALGTININEKGDIYNVSKEVGC
jgi:hypothetical protein